MRKDYIVQVLQKCVGSKWYWRLRSRNGRTLAHSENYSHRSLAAKTAKRIAMRLNCLYHITMQ